MWKGRCRKSLEAMEVCKERGEMCRKGCRDRSWTSNIEVMEMILNLKL